MLKFACPCCGVCLKTTPEKAGAVFACPRCKNKVIAPDSANERAAYASLDTSADPAKPAHSPRAHSSTKAVRPSSVWVAAGVGGTVVLLGCLGIGSLITVFALRGSQTPQERIVGTWDLEEPIPGEASRSIFYSDGTFVAPDAAFDMRELRYRFVNDNTIEVTLRPSQLTSESRPMRFHVRFPSDDKLVLTGPDGRERKLRRVR